MFSNVSVTGGQTIYIDPAVATGYDYFVSGGPLISSATFQAVAGDTDGYDIYLLGDLTNPVGHVGGSDPLTYLFGSAVSGFELRGIDATAGLDPLNAQAFVTGLTFDSDGTVDIAQTAIQQDASVPEPASWALMLGGFGLVGSTMRCRNSHRVAA